MFWELELCWNHVIYVSLLDVFCLFSTTSLVWTWAQWFWNKISYLLTKLLKTILSRNWIHYLCEMKTYNTVHLYVSVRRTRKSGFFFSWSLNEPYKIVKWISVFLSKVILNFYGILHFIYFEVWASRSTISNIIFSLVRSLSSYSYTSLE